MGRVRVNQCVKVKELYNTMKCERDDLIMHNFEGDGSKTCL